MGDGILNRKKRKAFGITLDPLNVKEVEG